ncbi:TATA-binding protein-associated phosphoprotein [Entamoeba marina]
MDRSVVVKTPDNFPDNKKRMSDRYVRNEKDMKDLESFQQAVLLALLNQSCGFTIQRPFKQSKSVKSKPEIYYIRIGEETINLHELAEEQCKYFYDKGKQENIKLKTAQRRHFKNKSTFTTHFLIDLSVEFGMFFNSKMSKKSTKCLQIERINEIFYKDNLILSRSEMILRGRAINNFLMSLVHDSPIVEIPVNDPRLEKYLQMNLSSVSGMYSVRCN